MAVQFQLYWHLFLSIGALALLSQASQNQSSNTPSPTSTQQAAASSASPTQLPEANANQPFTRPREFKGRFTITNKSWKTEYGNVKSSEYSTLKASLESELNNALENAIPGFVTCVVQWFNRGSVITHFAVYVTGNQDLTSEKLQNILIGAWSSGSLASFTLENIIVESEESQDEQATEETGTFFTWELWKIIAFGGLLIVLILLILIIVLLFRNRRLKKTLSREKRTTGDGHQHRQQQRHVPSRAAFSIIAASSAEELATILQNERRGQLQQVFKGVEGKQRKSERFHSHTYSAGTARSAEKFVDSLRDSQHMALQKHRSSVDKLAGYTERQLSGQTPVHETTKENKEIKDLPSKSKKHKTKTKKDKKRPGSVVAPSTKDSSTCEGNFKPSPDSIDDKVTPSKSLQETTNAIFGEPQIPSDSNKVTTPAVQESQQEDQKIAGKDENEASSGQDKPESNDNHALTKVNILSKVQAFEKGAISDDTDSEKNINQEPKREPKKLKHIQFESSTSQQDDKERMQREAEIRPLGGIVKKFNVRPLRSSSLEKEDDDQ